MSYFKQPRQIIRLVLIGFAVAIFAFLGLRLRVAGSAEPIANKFRWSKKVTRTCENCSCAQKSVYIQFSEDGTDDVPCCYHEDLSMPCCCKIQQKALSMIAREIGTILPYSTENTGPGSLFHIYDDQDLQNVLKLVTERVKQSVLEQEGYSHTTIDFLRAGSHDPFKAWGIKFFFTKDLPKVPSKKSLANCSRSVMHEEYKRIAKIIVDIFNQTFELQPYLKRLVTMRDIDLSLMVIQLCNTRPFE